MLHFLFFNSLDILFLDPENGANNGPPSSGHYINGPDFDFLENADARNPQIYIDKLPENYFRSAANRINVFFLG